MNPDQLIETMMNSHDELPLKVAEAIRDFEGWKLDVEQSLKRIRQCLRADANRGFKLRWLPIVVRLTTYYGGPELITGLIDEVRRDTEYELRQDAGEMRFARSGRDIGRRTG